MAAKRKSAGRPKKKGVKKKSATNRAARSSSSESAQDATRASAFRMTSDEVEAALTSNEQVHLLEEYFGEEQLFELRELAAQANSRNTRGGPRVLVLPGIMGSKLGTKGTFLNNTIWVDPIDIVRGNLTKLSLRGGNKRIKPLGVILFAYLQLKLRLKIAGFNADFHPFDWRQSLDDLGSELADRIREETGGGAGSTASQGQSLYLVAHSMGGLVSRAAMAKLGDQPDAVQRLIMLGTPNHGSFAPVQALRAEYDTVRKVAALDVHHTAEQLASSVFNTLPGLYQMLPFAEKFSGVDLYDIDTWPTTKPTPREDVLSEAQAVQESLALGSDKMRLIAGVNQDTVTDLQLNEDGDFKYLITKNGDGTVPLAFAKLNNVPTWYADEGHGSLPNNQEVIRATIDLLQTGTTSRLPGEWSPERRASEREWKPTDEPFGGRRGEEISAREVRHLLSDLAAPMKPTTQVARVVRTDADTGELSKAPIVVGRKRQHRIDMFMAQGDVTQVDTRAVVLGLFNDVAPSGAASAFDRRLNGVITEFTERRMFSGNVGEIFVMPAARQRVQTEMVVFAGLGSFDAVDGDVLRMVAENVARTLISTGVNEFATVLIGGNSSAGLRDSLGCLVDGFLSGIKDADTNRRMRSITFCEHDPDRFELLRRELLYLSMTPLMDDVEVTVETVPVDPAPSESSRQHDEHATPDPCYLFVHRQSATYADPDKPEASMQNPDRMVLQSSVLTPTGKATVVTGSVDVDNVALRNQLAKLHASRFTETRARKFGTELAELVLPDSIRTMLASVEHKTIDQDADAHPFVVIHDAEASRIPWETLCINNWFPASTQSMSRKYAAENLSVAKWLERRRESKTLSVLLVVDPTEDLPGAEGEGEVLEGLLQSGGNVEVTSLKKDRATWSALKSELRSGNHDVLHYAGHAFFDPVNRHRSGLVCHGKRVFSGVDLAGIGQLPSLAFINGCEAARVRSLNEPADGRTAERRVEQNASLAEAFLRGGIANYVGTYWPVNDVAAKTFSKSFYTSMIQGKSMAEALIKARTELRKQKSFDWANYIHYGSPHFRLKK